METTSVARRYGGALYDYALEQDARDAIRTDCAAILALIHGSKELAEFVADPTIPPQDEENTLIALFDGKVDPSTMRFLRFLASKRRLDQLPGVCAVFEQRVCEELGIIKVAVTAAHELSESQATAMKDRLAARYKKEIDAEIVVDPALIGGFKVKVGDQIFDHSLATKLKRFEENVLRIKGKHAKLEG